MNIMIAVTNMTAANGGLQHTLLIYAGNYRIEALKLYYYLMKKTVIIKIRLVSYYKSQILSLKQWICQEYKQI